MAEDCTTTPHKIRRHLTITILQSAAQRSRPVDNLLYLNYEFQPTSEARRRAAVRTNRSKK
jgi:hypothetical protein